MGRTAVLFLACAVLTACDPAESRQAGARRELALTRLTSAVCSAVPGAKILVVGNPFAVKPGASSTLTSFEQASLKGVRKGLEGRGVWVGSAYPELKPGALEDPRSFPVPPGATTPVSFLTAKGAWDRLWEQHRDATVWVSLIGFPEDVRELQSWTRDGGPRWALFLPDFRVLGGLPTVRTAFADGRILAVVLNRPGAPPESEGMTGSPEEEFERRYLLVTRENLEATIRDWPQLFP